MDAIRITESPRDAIQGLPTFIPTQAKADYINLLLKVGFDIIDIGSFVSPKAIPQLSDTAEVIKKLDLPHSKSRLMVIIGNLQGAVTACRFDEITWLSFPFSVSETFLKLNINAGFDKGRLLIDDILAMCEITGKSLMVYLTMAFGNPYGEKWEPDMVWKWTEKLMAAGVSHFALSDITGEATPGNIAHIFSVLRSDFATHSFALHLHTTSGSWYDKIDAAWQNGCRHFDAVINGLGGCPMTGYEMLGNLDTSLLLEYAEKNRIDLKIDKEVFQEAVRKAYPFYSLGHGV